MQDLYHWTYVYVESKNEVYYMSHKTREEMGHHYGLLLHGDSKRIGKTTVKVALCVLILALTKTFPGAKLVQVTDELK
jgi:hypothetical protein